MEELKELKRQRQRYYDKLSETDDSATMDICYDEIMYLDKDISLLEREVENAK